MKLLLIQPSHLDEKGEVYKTKKSLVPSLTMPYISALTPPEFDVEIIDDHVDEIDFKSDHELIGITCYYTQFKRAYRIADQFREQGKKVVMGGFHVSACPEEALSHSDCIVIGEAEFVWEELLNDFKNGTLERVYSSKKFHDLKNLPIPRFELLNLSKYRLPFLPVQTSRGCPHDCEFCSVAEFFERTFRTRPIEDVIRDVIATGRKKIFFVDDNIAINQKYAEELFKALIPLKIKWISQSNISIADNDGLVELAAKSGCIGLYIGIESINNSSLKIMGKSFNKISKYKDSLNKLKRVGITPLVSMIFGFDSDDEGVFDDTLKFLLDCKVPVLLLYLLTPIPGTKLERRLKAEGRFIHKDWSYNFPEVIFKPKTLSPERLKNGYWEVYNKFYSIRSIIKRLLLPPIRNLRFLLILNFIIRRGVKKRERPLSG